MAKADYEIMGRGELVPLYKQKLKTLHQIGQARDFSIEEIPRLGISDLVENLKAFDVLLLTGKR